MSLSLVDCSLASMMFSLQRHDLYYHYDIHKLHLAI